MKTETEPRGIFRRGLDRATWSISQTLRTKEQGRENFGENLRKQLETHSVLIYFNHFSLLDPGIILKILGQEELLGKTSVFTSQRHFDGKIQGGMIRAASRCKHFEILPVVQKKRKDQEKYPEYKAINSRATRKALSALKTPGNIVVIAPEGTRSHTGGLIKAEDGTMGLFELVRNYSLAYPIAMKHVKIIIPFITKTEVCFAETPFNYEEVAEEARSKEITVTDTLMGKLADLLPLRNKGAYR